MCILYSCYNYGNLSVMNVLKQQWDDVVWITAWVTSKPVLVSRRLSGSPHFAQPVRSRDQHTPPLLNVSPSTPSVDNPRYVTSPSYVDEGITHWKRSTWRQIYWYKTRLKSVAAHQVDRNDWKLKGLSKKRRKPCCLCGCKPIDLTDICQHIAGALR